MSKVVMHNVVSVDGYIADVNDDVGPLFDWYFSGDTHVAGFTVTRQSAAYLESTWAAIGCLVIGRHLFDLMNGWEGTPPAGIPHVVVVSHRPRPESWHPEAPYHFVEGVSAAVGLAKELAAGREVVGVAAGDVGGQCLAAGLVDEVAMDMAPVVLGSGKRFFGQVEDQHLLENPDLVVEGDRVLHLRFRVRHG
jgi:dihydrofolate reductase